MGLRTTPGTVGSSKDALHKSAPNLRLRLRRRSGELNDEASRPGLASQRTNAQREFFDEMIASYRRQTWSGWSCHSRRKVDAAARSSRSRRTTLFAWSNLLMVRGELMEPRA